MTTEEKAKAYDDAIDKVAHFIKKHIGLGCMIHPNSSEAKELFNIFPELKESDDERIRKDLTAFIKSRLAGFPICDRFISWLEKQGEQNLKFRIGDTLRKVSTGDIVTISEIDTENKEYRLTNTGFIPFEFEYLWQLVEQNSAWSEEDKNRFSNLIYLVEHSNEGKGTKEGFVKFINRLKSLRPYDFTKADTRIRREIIKYFKCQSNDEPTIKDKHNKWINWLISLGKGSAIKEQGDWNWINRVEDALDFAEEKGRITYDEYLYYVGLIESLKNRYTWKPSEDQLKYLAYVVDDAKHRNDVSINGFDAYMPLFSLYQDLKKLIK